MLSKMSIIALVALVANLAPHTLAHTWIEEYQVVGPNGSYIGDRGFSRGYVARTDADFEGDANSLWLLPQSTAVMPDGGVRLRINASDSLCHPNQRTSNYSNPEYPKLKAAPGNFVAMKYLENGHVTLPWNQPGKPLEGGTVYVYGTIKPINDEKIVDVMKWNKEGTGGDGRGWLLSAQNFDDGRCHQINDCTLSVERQAVYPNYIPDQNATAEQWCESDVQLPTNIKPGTLTTYWVWQWPTEPEKECIYPEGKDEYYTTCADFEIEGDSPGDIKIVEEVATNTLVQENFQTKAVESYMARTARVTPSVIVEDWHMKVATSFKVNPSWSSSCNSSFFFAQASASAAGFPPVPPPPSCPAGKWATGTLSAIVAQSALVQAKATSTPEVTAAQTAPDTAPPVATGGPNDAGSRPAPAPPASQGQSSPPNPSPTAVGGALTVTLTTYATQYVTLQNGQSTQPAPAAPSAPAASAPSAPAPAVPSSPASAPPSPPGSAPPSPPASAAAPSAPAYSPPAAPSEAPAPSAAPSAPLTAPSALTSAPPATASPEASSAANGYPTVLTIATSNAAQTPPASMISDYESSSTASPESVDVEENGFGGEHVARHKRRSHPRHFA